MRARPHGVPQGQHASWIPSPTLPTAKARAGIGTPSSVAQAVQSVSASPGSSRPAEDHPRLTSYRLPRVKPAASISAAPSDTQRAITLDIPEALLRRLQVACADVPRAVLEGFAVESYRTGTVSRAEVRQLLGHASIWETEAFLTSHDAWPEPNLDELTNDLDALRAAAVTVVRDTSALRYFSAPVGAAFRRDSGSERGCRRVRQSVITRGAANPPHPSGSASSQSRTWNYLAWNASTPGESAAVRLALPQRRPRADRRTDRQESSA